MEETMQKDSTSSCDVIGNRQLKERENINKIEDSSHKTSNQIKKSLAN